MICQKEQFTLPSNTQKFMLYKIECSQTLSVSLSLYENDIKTTFIDGVKRNNKHIDVQ